MRKTNLAFIIGFIVCFAAAYRGMVFSPSFTMMYVVAGMGLCILGEILDMAQAGKRFGSREQKLIGLLSRILYIFGMFWAFPAVIIYATGDDWMNGCMRAAAVGSVVLCGIWLGWMWKTRGIQEAVWGKALELLVSLAAALLAVFCGINSVALMPYGIWLLILTIARLKENNDSLIRKILFCLGLVLIAALPVLPALGGIF